MIKEPEYKDDISLNKKIQFNPNDIAPDKPGSEVPTSHNEKRDCNMELDGIKLQKIIVGPKEIDFGEIFKSSEQTRTFWIKNCLRTCIFLKFEFDDESFPELKRTYLPYNFSKLRSKVIYPMQTEGFNLVFYSNDTISYNKFLKYTINKIYSFGIIIKANVTFVKLIHNKLNKFTFKNEKNNDKVEMMSIQTIAFENQGNAAAHFSFGEVSNPNLWIINPKNGIVEKGKTTEVTVAFNPREPSKSDQKEEVKCNLVNGNPIPFEFIGSCPEARCSLSTEVLNFDEVHIGNPETVEFYIKNENKVRTAYSIEHEKKNILSFKDSQGYIDVQKKSIQVTIKCLEEIDNFNEKVIIYIRGGKPLELTIKAKVITPKVRIKEPKFDFGTITFGGEEKRILTFINDSKLPAVAIVNLNNNPKLKDFKVIIVLFRCNLVVLMRNTVVTFVILRESIKEMIITQKILMRRKKKTRMKCNYKKLDILK